MSRLRSLLGLCLGFELVAACSGGGGNLAPPGASAQQAPESTTLPSASSYQLLYSFGKSKDGVYPEGNLINVNGTLYTTTYCGGAYASSRCTASGTSGGGIVGINVSGTNEKVTHSFAKGTDGSSPDAGLLAVKGTLYGTTVYGGAKGLGTVFAITSGGKYTVIHSFTGGSKDGAEPFGLLIDVNGTLYGTTQYGGNGSGCGTGSCGTVFAITAGKEKVLHNFGAGKGDGAFPAAGLHYLNGTLYGTTTGGGPRAKGTVFSIAPSGTEKVVYGFTNGADGGIPVTGLADIKGTLYGTTASGGVCSGKTCGGTLFSVTTKGVERVLHAFALSGDGDNPYDTPVAVNSTLYGNTYGGGSYGKGSIFKVTTRGTESVLYSFGKSRNDGANPYGGLLYSGGKLYGTTVNGGANAASKGGDGTIFELSP